MSCFIFGFFIFRSIRVGVNVEEVSSVVFRVLGFFWGFEVVMFVFLFFIGY